MRQCRRRLMCALAMIGLAPVAAVATVANVWAATRNRLTVTNSSGQGVHDLTVAVGGETIRFGDLASGASASARFRIDHEERFEVRCRLTDGTAVHESTGYVTWADDLLGVCARLLILPEGALYCSHATPATVPDTAA
ncbi:hypothetical protein R5W23_005183 [Gemmata sp. JC673]|uniref:TIGR03067 domain-containing protein n=1 Tax=Gemmata algarum TaxID=2975278 RepID=A0ABU5F8N3_9BACT|nr:hypothetical protein [Gemmata algarum]MDY3563569.1 hypothetical protein [Gemmata algarum]